MQTVLIVLRFIHIVCGAYWVGAVLFAGIFLGPSVAAVGPSGGAVMAELLRRRYYDFTVFMATLAILAGAVLLWQDSAHFDGTWFASPFGRGISTGMLAALIAWVMGVFMIRPLVYRMADIGPRVAQSQGSDPGLAAEFGRARDRLISLSKVTVVLLVIAVGAMAVARYL